MTIPIFIIVHDRLEVLKKCIASYETQIKTPIEIVLHDVASTFPPCLEYLQEMRENGYKVYRSEYNNHKLVMNSINDYLKKHPKCQYYVVTDPDIELDNVPGDILEFYTYLIAKYGKNKVVGPMLRIDDIPDYYPKKKLAIKLHKAQFWNKRPSTIQWRGVQRKIQHSPIDTTFQLVHRSNKNGFPRSGIRCYAPYAARHLDWYINPKDATPDQQYYSNAASKTAHWGRHIEKPDFS